MPHRIYDKENVLGIRIEVKILKQILKDYPLEDFLEKHFTKMPFSMPNGADNLQALLDWTVVEKVLKTKKSKLRIVQDGRVIKDYVDLDYPAALSHHKSGHTLLLRYAERSHPALKSLADEFARYFHTPVDIQLYCTPANHNAFGWHYDVEEVFVIQTKGSKQFTIKPNSVHPNPIMSSIPKNLGFELEKTNIELTVTLEAGDWLYIPSGWWHIARTKSESMHISIGLMPSSSHDILNFLPVHLSNDLFWRTRIPAFRKFKDEEEEIDFYSRVIVKSVKEINEKMTDRDFVKAYIQHIKNKINN